MSARVVHSWVVSGTTYRIVADDSTRTLEHLSRDAMGEARWVLDREWLKMASTAELVNEPYSRLLLAGLENLIDIQAGSPSLNRPPGYREG